MVTENPLQHHQRRYQSQGNNEDNRGGMIIQQHTSGMDPGTERARAGMDAERAAALQHAVAAGFASGNGLPVGMDLSGLVQSGLMSHMDQQNSLSNQQRKQREFIPDNKKDESYWDRRRRNNEAAKRSREKRRLNDMVLEGRVVELTKEVHILRAQLSAVRDKYGINPESLISIDQVLASLPSPDQMLSLPRPRSRLLNGGLGSISPSPSNRSLSPLPGSGGLVTSNGIQHAQQQRQSVLMSLGRQRSPSPYQQSGGMSYRFNDSGAGARQMNSSVRHQQQQQERPLPPLPALTPVNEDVINAATSQELHDKVNQYFDLCSNSSSDGSHSPIDPAVAAGRLLPHKLRHKSHLGADAAATASAAAALLTLNEIKHEPGSPLMMMENGRRSTESCSDERDSGVSSGDWVSHSSRSSSSRSQPEVTSILLSSPPRSDIESANPHVLGFSLTQADLMCNQPAKRMRMSPPDHHHGQPDENNEELRTHIARLASELESLKTLMLGNNGPCNSNGSNAGRGRSNNSNGNSNNNNYRLH